MLKAKNPGWRIKRLREQRGMTVAALGTACTTPNAATIRTYEIGTALPTAANVNAIATALFVPKDSTSNFHLAAGAGAANSTTCVVEDVSSAKKVVTANNEAF